MLFITYMENLIIDIQGSEIWQYIHSNKTLDEIMIYLQKDADYSKFEKFIDFIKDKYELDVQGITPNFIVSILMISKFSDDLIGKNRVEEEDMVFLNPKRDI